MGQRRSRFEYHVQSLEPRRLLTTTPTFTAHADIPLGGTPISITAGDFNRDGKQDLAVGDQANDDVKILFGNGNGTFTAGPVLAVGGEPTDLDAVDLNGDGITDLLVATSAANGSGRSALVAFLSNGDGTFGAAQVTPVGNGSTTSDVFKLAVADFNGDGHPDVAVTDYNAGTVSVLLGTGTGAFTPSASYATASSPDAVTIGDYNGDGKLDVAVTGTVTSTSGLPQAQVTILLGAGDGTFTIAEQLSGGSSSADALATADFTGDGSDDLIVGTGDSTATVLQNTGGLNFTDLQDVALPGAPLSIGIADFNFDGSADAVTANEITSDVTVLTNSGTGTFTATTFDTGTEPTEVAVADFNGDGKPDIATADAGAGSVSILLNTTPGTVPQPTVTAIGSSATPSAAGSPVTFTADVDATGTLLSSATGLPTGTVDFYDGATLLGSGTIVSGTDAATFTTSSLAVGSHSVTAEYLSDGTFAASTSAAIAETITATATLGPDLVAAFVSPKLPSEIVPNRPYPVSLRITNQGNEAAVGEVTNTFSLGGATLTATPKLVTSSIDLKPGHSIVVSGTVSAYGTGDDVAASLTVTVNSTGAVSETDTANNTASQDSPTTVVNEFGDVGGRSNVALELIGPQDRPAEYGYNIFRLTGPGTGTAILGGPDGVVIDLSGTTRASTFSYTPSRKDPVAVDGISDASPLGAIAGPGLSLGGFGLGGGNLTLTGGVGRVILDGDTSGTWTVSGSVKQIVVGSLSDTKLAISGAVGSFVDHGNLTGSTIAAASFGSVLVEGTCQDNDVLAGANLTAGTFAAGSIGSLRVVGSTTDSMFAAGPASLPSGQTVTLLAGGSIRSITFGLLDTQSVIAAAALPATARVDGESIRVAGDSQFDSSTVPPIHPA